MTNINVTLFDTQSNQNVTFSTKSILQNVIDSIENELKNKSNRTLFVVIFNAIKRTTNNNVFLFESSEQKPDTEHYIEIHQCDDNEVCVELYENDDDRLYYTSTI